MLHKYIPVQYNRLYYVYDCMDGSLYPCDKNVYFAFRKYTFSELLESIRIITQKEVLVILYKCF